MILGNLSPLLRQLRALNAMLAARARLTQTEPETGTFAAFFKKRDEPATSHPAIGKSADGSQATGSASDRLSSTASCSPPREEDGR